MDGLSQREEENTKKAGGTQIYLEMFIKYSYLGVKVQLRVDLKVFLTPLYKV